jgi:hypothetical protein
MGRKKVHVRWKTDEDGIGRISRTRAIRAFFPRRGVYHFFIEE